MWRKNVVQLPKLWLFWCASGYIIVGFVEQFSKRSVEGDDRCGKKY